MRKLFAVVMAISFVGASLGLALGAVPGLGPDEAPVKPNNRTAPPSPTGGLSTGETTSRIDDYIYQDDQVNLTEKSGVVKVLRVNQKNLVNDYVVATYQLKNAKAMDVVREIRSAFRTLTAKEGGRAEVIRDKVTNEAFVQVICPKFQLPWIEKAIAALDEPWIKENADGFQRVYYRATNRNIGDMQAIADTWCDGDGVTVLDSAANAAMRREEPYRSGEWLKALGTLDIPANQIVLDAAIYEVNIDDNLKLGLDYIAWKNGPGRNLFDFLSAGENAHDSSNGATSTYCPLLKKTITTTPQGIAISKAVNTDYSQAYCSFNAMVTAAYVDFMAAKGKARVVARPKIVARSAQPATFSATDQILAFVIAPDVTTRTPLQTTKSSPATTANTTVATTVTHYAANGTTVTGVDKTGTTTTAPITPAAATFSVANDIGVDNRTLNEVVNGVSTAATTGVDLTVTPNIGLESSELAITVTYRTLAGTAPQGTPIINTRSFQTKARVRDGQPLVLGGLARNEKVDTYDGVPFLSSIPVVGLLFGGESHKDADTQFVIVLTPTVAVAGQSDLIKPEDVKTKNMVTGKASLDYPRSPYGFDQWLLDDLPTLIK